MKRIFQGKNEAKQNTHLIHISQPKITTEKMARTNEFNGTHI